MRRRNVLIYNVASIGADSAFRPLSSISEGRSNLIRRNIAANEIEQLRDFNILFVANGLEEAHEKIAVLFKFDKLSFQRCLSAAIFVFLSPTFRFVFHAVFAWRSALTLFEAVIRNRSHPIDFQIANLCFSKPAC